MTPYKSLGDIALDNADDSNTWSEVTCLRYVYSSSENHDAEIMKAMLELETSAEMAGSCAGSSGRNPAYHENYTENKDKFAWKL